MPIGPNRGDALTEQQKTGEPAGGTSCLEKKDTTIYAIPWNGFYQGWDLNPAQLPMRYTGQYLPSSSKAMMMMMPWND